MRKSTGFAADCEAMSKRLPPPVVMVTDRTDGPGRLLRFDQPKSLLVAIHPEEVEDCLHQADKALAEGNHVAGYISYEAALGLDRAFETSRAYRMPLLWLGVFSAPLCADGPEPHVLSRPLEWRAELTPQDYEPRLIPFGPRLPLAQPIKPISPFACRHLTPAIRGSSSVSSTTTSPRPAASISTPAGGRYVLQHRNSSLPWMARR